MARLTSFQQDPNSMPGAGMFMADDGQGVYAYHPEMANQLSQPNGAAPSPPPFQPSPELTAAAAPGPDMRVAGPGGGIQPVDALNAPNAGNPLASLSFKGAGGQAPSPATGGGPPSGPTVPASIARDPVAPSSGAAPENMGQAISQLQENRLGAAMLKEQNAPVRKVPGHYTPSTKEVAVADQGAPVSEENRALLEDAHYGGLAATQNAGDAEKQRLHAAAVANMQDAVAQKKQLDMQQGIANDTQGLVAQDRANLDRYRQELEQNQKSFNPNRLFEKGSTEAIGAAIFRAMGTYAQIRGHMASNPAGEVIDAAIERDVAQQRQAIESGKGNVNNALSRLQEHYGDLNQATSALRVLQHSYADSQQQFLANSTGIPQVIAKTQQTIADKQGAYAKEMNAFDQAAYGKHSAKVAEKYIAPTTTGGAPSVDKQLERAGKLAGIEHTNAETEKLRAEGKIPKGEELVVPDGKGGTIRARSGAEAADLRTGYADLKTGQDAAAKMIATAKDTSIARGANPFTLEKERTWNSDREALMHAVNNALTGKSVAVREASMQRFEHALAGGPGSPGAAAAIEEINGIITKGYQNKLDSQLSPGAKTPSVTPAGATEYKPEVQ